MAPRSRKSDVPTVAAPSGGIQPVPRKNERYQKKNTGGMRERKREANRATRKINRIAQQERAKEAVTELKFDGEYTDELGQLLSEMVADGITLDTISKLPNTPPLRLMLRWIADDSHPFRKLYYDAKNLMVALYEERALDAATQPLIGVIKTKKQAVTRDGDVVDLEEERIADNVERSRLVVDTYKWTLEHLAPRKHGRKATPDGQQPNEQLEALFSSLKEGPVE